MASTVGGTSVIGATGADTIGGATPTGGTLSGTFMKGNSLFGLNILINLSTFSLSAFSISFGIDEDANSTGGGGIGGFSRSIDLILAEISAKSSGFMDGLRKRGGIGKLGIAG